MDGELLLTFGTTHARGQFIRPKDGPENNLHSPNFAL